MVVFHGFIYRENYFFILTKSSFFFLKKNILFHI